MKWTSRYVMMGFALVMALSLSLSVTTPSSAIGSSATASSAGGSVGIASSPDPGTYTNPVNDEDGGNAIAIRALDGYYYLMTSSRWSGGSIDVVPTYRSTDMVDWTYIGNVWDEKPDWMGPGALGANDLAYFNGRYYLYYANFSSAAGSFITVATAPSPAGPWTDLGRPLIPRGEGCCVSTGPSLLIGEDGIPYLYYGSFSGGIVVQKLTPDGLHRDGEPYQIGHAHRYEASKVIRRTVNGQTRTYLFNSAAPCCQGPNTAYNVVANRSESAMGPFTDHRGLPMLLDSPVPLDSPKNLVKEDLGGQGGGYPVIKPNGNRWHGVGANQGVVTDLSGADWTLYYGVDGEQGWVPGRGPDVRSTYRQTLLDRLRWTDQGWPVLNGGAGPSAGPRRAPVTDPAVGDNFNASKGCAAPGDGQSFTDAWETRSGSWTERSGDCTSGGFVRQSAISGRAVALNRQPVGPGQRLECDVRLAKGSQGRAGCLVRAEHAGGSGAQYVAAYLDAGRHALVTSVYASGQPIGREDVTPLPDGIDLADWNHLVVEEVGDSPGRPMFRFSLVSQEQDVLATHSRPVPAAFGHGSFRIGISAEDARADFDNVTVAPRADDELVPEPTPPEPGKKLAGYSDEFDGKVGRQWSWIREDPDRHGIVDGQLEITPNGGLTNGNNTVKNLLLQEQPPGDYMVETKLTFDPDRNFANAGLYIYADDDNHIKLVKSHFRSLSKTVTGRETLEPQPDSRIEGQPECPYTPSPDSHIAVTKYSHEECPNKGSEYGYPVNAEPTLNGATASDPQVTQWLRIYRDGDVYRLFSSLDGEHWVRANAYTLTQSDQDFPLSIALSAGGANAPDMPARFHYVRVYRME